MVYAIEVARLAVPQRFSQACAEPHLLAAGTFGRGQPATIVIPHTSGIAHTATTVTTLSSRRQDLQIATALTLRQVPVRARVGAAHRSGQALDQHRCPDSERSADGDVAAPAAHRRPGSAGCPAGPRPGRSSRNRMPPGHEQRSCQHRPAESRIQGLRRTPRQDT